jgi:hypothetical protein
VISIGETQLEVLLRQTLYKWRRESLARTK